MDASIGETGQEEHPVDDEALDTHETFNGGGGLARPVTSLILSLLLARPVTSLGVGTPPGSR